MQKFKVVLIFVILLAILGFVSSCISTVDNNNTLYTITVYGNTGNIIEQYETDSKLWRGDSYVAFRVDGKKIMVHGNFIIKER